ncbi:MAG: glycosyltransferase family 32 protein [Alphaproteobacteria bacterium]|jgi:mannosyltransferase OCH1-like enzyme
MTINLKTRKALHSLSLFLMCASSSVASTLVMDPLYEQETFFKSFVSGRRAAQDVSLMPLKGVTPVTRYDPRQDYEMRLDLQEMIDLQRAIEESFKTAPVHREMAQNPLLKKIKEGKARLSPVREDEKNLYAKSLKTNEPYGAREDFSSFVKKIRQGSPVLLKNESDQMVHLRLKLKPEDHKNKTDRHLKKISLAPGEFYILEQNQTVLDKLTLTKTPQLFINPKWTEDNHIQFTIEKTEDRHFLHQYHHFDFETKHFSDESLQNPNQSEEEARFKRDFNAHLDYVDHVFAKQEGTTLAELDAHRKALYQKNNIASLLEKDPTLLDSSQAKIPLITHKIWVTSDENPISLPDYYLGWYEESIKHNPTSAGWTHYLWIESKEKLPELAKKLENHPHIKLMELKDLPQNMVAGDEFNRALKAKKFGKATDIARLEILKQLGGFYLDTDYQLFQSLIPYSKAYDMIMGLEPMSALLCNAFIGARPEHPTVNMALDMIKRNLNPEAAPEYIRQNNDEGWKTIVETGPGMITAAFKHSAGQKGNVDIALPPQLIYPTPTNDYPRKQVVKPYGPIPAEALGAHYWETAWMRKEFGSQG